MAVGAERVAGDGRGGMGWRHGQAPRDTQRVCQPPDAAGLGQQPRGQCPADSAADAAMDGRRPDMLVFGGSAVCRVGGIGGGGVNNGGLTLLRMDLRLELRVSMGVTMCAWSVASGGLWLGRGLRQAVCGVWWPGRTASRPPPPRHAHDITHTATDHRCCAMHTSTRCGGVDMGCGCGVWGVGLAAQHRRAPPPLHTCPRQSSPPTRVPEAARITSGLPRLKSHAAPLESRFAEQHLALALDGGGDGQGVCDVTEACGLGRGGPEGCGWPRQPRLAPAAPGHHRPRHAPSPPDAHHEVAGGC